jgi:hypothetical protein
LLGSRDSDVTESLADDEGELLFLFDTSSHKVNSILSNIDDEFPTIDIISRLKSPVKSVAVAQDVDKSLKPKYKAKDFHKISSENKCNF